MNEIFSRLGEFNEVLEVDPNNTSKYSVTDKNAPRRKCLAACENQVFLLASYVGKNKLQGAHKQKSNGQIDQKGKEQ